MYENEKYGNVGKEEYRKRKKKEMHLDISSSVLCRSRAPKRDDHHVVSPGDQDLGVQGRLTNDLMAVQVEQLVAHRDFQMHVLSLQRTMLALYFYV